VRVADAEVIRLGGFMAAVAGVPRVPPRVAQAAGTVIGASRIIEQGCRNVRMSIFASGVNHVGATKWMILHGSGMAGNPEILRLEGQLQHARRAQEGLVMAGASMECPPAASIGDGVPVADSLSAAPPVITVPDAAVQLTPLAGSVAPKAPTVAGRSSSSGPETTSAEAGASPSRGTPSAASHVFTDEELDEILGEPRIDALMRTQRNIFDGRPRGSPEASGPVGAAPTAGGGNADVENEEDDYYVRDAECGRAIDAADGPVDQQPGVGAPPPPAIIESTVAPALVQPSDKVVGHVTKLLSLKGRRAQRVREAFRGMVGGVASEHKCALKSVQACLIPWWPYKVSEDPSVVVEPEAIWPLQVAVPERLTLTTKRSRDGDAEGVKIITLVALPPVSGAIDQLVAAIMLLHDKEPATQQTLANFVFLAKKAEILSAAEAATEVAARLAASKADAAASRAASATPPGTSGGGLVPIAPAPVSARAAAVNPFPPAVPRRPQDPFRLLGNLASGVKPPGLPTPTRLPAGGRVPVAEARRAARVAAAEAAALAAQGGVNAQSQVAGECTGLVGNKRRRVVTGPVGRGAAAGSSEAEADSATTGSHGGSRLCTTSGRCILVSPAGLPVAEADAFFERKLLHGHVVPVGMVAVLIDVVISPGYSYKHERHFPKERPATQDTRPMGELHDCFIVWEKSAVMEKEKQNESE